MPHTVETDIAIQDEILKSVMDIDSFGVSTGQDLAQALDVSGNRLARRVNRAGAGLVTLSLIRDIRRQLRLTIRGLNQEYTRILSRDRGRIARIEFDSMTRTLLSGLDQSTRNSLYRVSSPILQEALSGPVGGLILISYINTHLTGLEARVRQSILNDLKAKLSIKETANNLRKSFNLTRRAAFVMASSSILQAGEDARNLVFDQNSDMILGYKYLATLDVRTCQLCAADDGRIEKNREDLPSLLRHLGCRCIIAPVTQFSEDIDRSAIFLESRRIIQHRDVNPLTGRRQQSTVFRNERVGTVTGRTTFNDFFNRQPASWKRDWLGKSRFELWKEGRLSVFDAAQNNRVLRVDELMLRKNTPLALRRRTMATRRETQARRAAPGDIGVSISNN